MTAIPIVSRKLWWQREYTTITNSPYVRIIFNTLPYPSIRFVGKETKIHLPTLQVEPRAV